MSTSPKEKNPHAGHRDRMRKKFLENPENLEKHELLELLLYSIVPRQNTNDISHRILNQFNNSFITLLQSDYRDIEKRGKVSENTAVFLKAIEELLKRCQREKAAAKLPITSIDQCGKYAVDLLLYETTEQFYLFCLDGGKKLKQTIKLSSGSQSTVQVIPADVVKEALFAKAVFVILVHNHPGGTLAASKADIRLTEALIDALACVNISVLDHIIAANNQYYSFLEHGIMNDRR